MCSTLLLSDVLVDVFVNNTMDLNHSSSENRSFSCGTSYRQNMTNEFQVTVREENAPRFLSP